MAGNVTALHGKTSDSEKITINLGYVDLGRVDLWCRRDLLQPQRFRSDGNSQSTRSAS
jgi:hypothetical protein